MCVYFYVRLSVHVQVATGPGALAGMTAVRVGGAKRVLLTSPSRTALQGLAQCVHANAARLVVERVKVAQLDWGNQVGPVYTGHYVHALAHCILDAVAMLCPEHE